MWAYIIFNIFLVFALSYLFSFANWQEIFAKRKNKKEREEAELQRSRSASLMASRSRDAASDDSPVASEQEPMSEKNTEQPAGHR